MQVYCNFLFAICQVESEVKQQYNEQPMTESNRKENAL